MRLMNQHLVKPVNLTASNVTQTCITFTCGNNLSYFLADVTGKSNVATVLLPVADPACSNDSSYSYPDTPKCSFPDSGTTFDPGGKVVLAPSSRPYTLRVSAWSQIDLSNRV
jgi:hypothetical protein